MEEGGRAGRPAAGAQATRAKLLRRVERERRQQVREEEGRGVGGRTGEREPVAALRAINVNASRR